MCKASDVAMLRPTPHPLCRGGALGLLALASLVATSCANDPPRVETHPSFEIARVQSWQWARDAKVLEESDPRLASDTLHQTLRHEIAKGLEQRGLKEVEGAGDVQVAYRVGIERQRRVEAEPVERPVGDDVFLGPPRVEVIDEESGHLVLELSTPDDQTLLWRGTVKTPLHRVAADAAREQQIRDAIDRLLGSLAPESASP